MTLTVLHEFEPLYRVTMSIDQTMPINYVRMIARELHLTEQDLHNLLADTALKPMDLHGGQASLTVTEQFTVMRNALALSQDPALGFRLGKLLHISTHGQMGVAALTSANLKEAIHALCDFAQIRAPFLQLKPETLADQLVLVVHCTVELDAGIRPLLMECICMLIQELVEFVIMRDLHEAEIVMDYSAPAYAEAYKLGFHSPVRFDGERVEFRLPLALLDTLCPTSDHHAYQQAIRLCRDILSKLEGDKTTHAQVKRILLASTPGSLSQEAVAQQLCITPRTLIRRLKSEKTNYREVQEGVLSELAGKYLIEENISVETIAVLLGYSDTANFRRAFKRWNQMTPQQYRDNHQT